MKVGVLSDTHFADLHEGLAFLRALCAGPLRDAELLLHAGDIVHPDLLYCFDGKPVAAVMGNCDEPSPELPQKRVVEAAGFRIGLVHGWGGPGEIVANVLSAFEGVPLDVLVFGHSHQPLCRRHGGVLLFNPGSATERRGAACHTVGMLDLSDTITGTIVSLDGVAGGYHNVTGGCP